MIILDDYTIACWLTCGKKYLQFLVVFDVSFLPPLQSIEMHILNLEKEMQKMQSGLVCYDYNAYMNVNILFDLHIALYCV